MATITITVTVSNPGSGNKYYLDGALGAYAATPGNTYKFDQADGSNSGHPLRFATAADAAGSSEYTTGVTTNGTPGSAGAYTQIEVTATTTQALFFYCTNHSGMGNSFNVGGTGTVQLQTRSGFPIQNLSSDPVPFAQAKINDPYAGVWSSGANANTGRSEVASAGTSTANMISGGEPPTTVNAEQWNGSSWTEVANLNTARYGLMGAGTTTAAVSFGGDTGPGSNRIGNTETWNGSAWTEVADLNEGRFRLGSAQSATSTAALAFGGADPGGGVASTETWNGSNWTEVGDLNEANYQIPAGAGTNTAALQMGGANGAGNEVATVESWNGSAWTEIADLNTARDYLGGAGTQTSALAYGGNLGSVTGKTESWDGSSWTEVNDMATARQQIGCGGASNQAALASVGETPSTSAATEEWAFSGIPPTAPAAGYSDAIVGQMYYNSTSGQFKAIKEGLASGSWSSGSALNTGRDNMSGFGASNSAALCAGGGPGSKADTELYDGSSWTEVNNLNTAGTYRQNQFGIYTSGIVAGAPGAVESWDGTNWTEIAELNTDRGTGAGAGSTNTSGIVFGGNSGAQTETWNGSAWTEVNDLNTGRDLWGQGGGTTSTAALAVGGTPNTAITESWNGTSWSEVNDLNTGRQQGAASTNGSPESFLMFAGSPNRSLTELWNGSSWTEVGDMGTGRQSLAGAGSTTSALGFGGSAPSGPGAVTTTEEWVAADFTINPVTTS